MRIAILPNLTRAHATQVTHDICQYLLLQDVEVIFDCETQKALQTKAYRALPSEELLQTCDVIIAVGGDGSLIHAAKKAVRFNKPVLGVNAGNLAFMAGVEKNELPLLKDLVEGNYEIDRRMLLDVFCDSHGELTEFGNCLNDVVIARGEQIKMITLNCFCDGKKINNYYADGIIISTPTGSTAYSLSAGGPVIDPRIESILLTPICTHSLFARSIIFDRNSELCIEVPKNKTGAIFISCDGDPSVEVKPGDKIIVRKSKQYADFIRLKNESFIDVLNCKLAQRRV